ncbi:leucyl/phenylalanyl-tRNA--protein transferase [Altibacter sp. HG106]|uniref:leucyl/phenylalanyl-tRNA--protein transferase n=1 Tax=Altibacter sp. HG106 TaxID=3023937 RepID=UPI00234FEC75|nr:leucyl/phenylalanyl-tRNA--protein transferase [Altibacter sp. HG106]MDC7995237.1 leucyl/phenylalanyl-tRNA--protein transferase [Altibacter sp. HG106]
MIPLGEKLWFPPVEEASEDGWLAFGGDLSAARLLLAYRSGIFPWYEAGQPPLWWSPDPRMILIPKEFKISKSFRKRLRTHPFRCTVNQAFESVISQCANISRTGQSGTWITSEMKKAYVQLHQQGHAVSVEVWDGEQLVGGLYGIDLPESRIFCGESMFSKVSDASKIALHYWVGRLEAMEYHFIDCQVYTQHLSSLGAREIPRTEFLQFLE